MSPELSLVESGKYRFLLINIRKLYNISFLFLFCSFILKQQGKCMIEYNSILKHRIQTPKLYNETVLGYIALLYIDAH